MSSVFVDTSYFLALEIAADRNHDQAKNHWQQVIKNLPLLVTTSFVFDEIVTFFNHRGFHYKAIQVGSSILESPSIQLIYIDKAHFFQGWSYMKSHQDKTYSLTDCISFSIMHQYKINLAFAFDKHFKQAGFQSEP